MAVKTFQIRTEPHEAQLSNGVALFFEPEAEGAEFLTAYGKLRDAQASLSGGGGKIDAATLDVAKIAELVDVAREFLAGMMVPESRERFAGMRLPYRVLMELIEWCSELYGGGSGNPGAAGGPSTG